MARQLDRGGLEVTAASKDAAACFDGAVDAFLGHRADCAARIADALLADARLPLAHCLQGFALKLLAREEFAIPAGASLAHARTAARACGVTPREAAMIDAQT